MLNFSRNYKKNEKQKIIQQSSRSRVVYGKRLLGWRPQKKNTYHSFICEVYGKMFIIQNSYQT